MTFSILCLKTARLNEIRRHYIVIYIQYVYLFSLNVQFCVYVFFFSMIIQLAKTEKNHSHKIKITRIHKNTINIRQACF